MKCTGREISIENKFCSSLLTVVKRTKVSLLPLLRKASSLIYNTSARPERTECDTSVTELLHERRECDTSAK